jgi:CSLREA domain-containing protein
MFTKSHHNLFFVLALFISIGFTKNTSALASQNSASAATFTVTKIADTNDGTCNADCSLREAVVAANLHTGTDIIVVPSGTYTLTIAGSAEDASATGDLDIAGDITINGAGAGSTIIDGNALDRVMDILYDGDSGYTVVLSGLTIQNGVRMADSDKQSAGIRSIGFLTINDSIVANNAGVGIESRYFGNLVLNNTIITGNSNPNGVGGVIANIVILDMKNSTISHNSGGWGGISTDNGFSMENSTVNDNSGTAGTGGMHIVGGGTIFNSTISGNHGTEGAGIWTNQGLTITNSTIVDNIAIGTGSGTSYTGNGGGLYFYGSSGVVNLNNTIIANNQSNAGSPNCSGPITSLGHNLISSSSGCTITAMLGDKFNVATSVGALANNGGFTRTHALLSGSPAINAGSNSACPAEDQRGVIRPQAGICDIGAYELEFSYKIYLPLILKKP